MKALIMKILAASVNNDLNAKIAKRFGHPEYYLLIDSNTMEFDVFPGARNDDRSQGFDHVKKRGIDCAVAGNFGPGNFQKLQHLNVKTYICRNMTVKEAVAKITAGEIEPISEPTMKKSVRGGGKHGGGLHL